MVEVNLQEILSIRDEGEQKASLELLFSTRIRPLIKKTVQWRFRSVPGGSQDVEDVCSEASLRLWKKMQQWIRAPDDTPVEDFSSYVSATTLNCCKEYLRSKYPRRWHLRNRLRYLFAHSDPFKIWKLETGEWMCGYRIWQGRRQISFEELQGRLEKSQFFQGTHEKNLTRHVTFVLQAAGGPLALDDLLSVLLVIPGIREEFQDIQVDPDREVSELAAPPAITKGDRESSSYLKVLWAEIRNLPVNQRIALLLNLRDPNGNDAITALPATGTASIRDIAEAMNISAEEFAILWNELPLDDLRIAQRLQLSRQQVINLRKSARERLHNRMKISKDVI